MGLLQRAVETYEANASLVGRDREGHAVLAPISHMMVNAGIDILLSREGKLLQARAVDRAEEKIPIPATEASASRTGSSPVPHPLCDQLRYVAPYSGEPYQMYVEQLERWASSEYAHPKLRPILAYVKGGTILEDLKRSGILELDGRGVPKQEKSIVRWRVSGEAVSECWKDLSLFDAYIRWYANRQSGSGGVFCMVIGQVAPAAEKHPKGVVPLNGNAKLISANDSSGFTYRGRFTQSSQALTIGYEASQKAHSAIRWLVEEQGKYYGGRLFLCWNPQGIPVSAPEAPFLDFDTEPSFTPSDYREKLKNTLLGKQQNQLTGKGEEASVVLAAFDAATTGRLALTDYNEYRLSEYLRRLYQWDSWCCWDSGPLGIRAPSLPQIVQNGFGTPRENKGVTRMETDDRVLRQQLQRLIDCRVNSSQRFPEDIKRRLVERASTPQAYERNCWLGILFTACAAVRKYRFDRLKEEWNVTLDERKKDRSYLFGRLLAIAEQAERVTYERGEERETNAMRMQTVFSRRPLSAWRLLEEKLNPYFRHMKPWQSKYYKDLIMDVVTQLDALETDLDRPLEDVYLLGYYSQRKALLTKKSEQITEE